MMTVGGNTVKETLIIVILLKRHASAHFSTANIFFHALKLKDVLVHGRGQASMMHSIIRHLGLFVHSVCDYLSCWWVHRANLVAALGIPQAGARGMRQYVPSRSTDFSGEMSTG